MRDVFICHASEDKQEVVEHLVSALKQANISYWYDKAEIKWGDSITKKVNEGLKISRFVIVVISKAFLSKAFPQTEFYSTLSREISSGEVKILPLIVTSNDEEKREILESLSLMQDKLYLTWNNNANEIVVALQSRLSDRNNGQEIEKHDSFEKDTKLNQRQKINLMEFQDRQEIEASVVFSFIPELAEQDPTISYKALVSLHKILRERLLDKGLQLRILSSIKGAIAVIPDSSSIYIHQHLSGILEDCKKSGIPVRLGITHGKLEVLKDVDNSLSFIGVPMNVAARLSTSDNNKGILYDLTYTNHVQPLPTSQNNDPLHPRYCDQVNIEGKPHDPIFKCREPNNPNLVLSQFNDNILPELEIQNNSINGIAIAYDLPKFSQGDGSELSKRFRSVIDCINSLKNDPIFPTEDSNQFFFSPGGDGGILILPIKSNISLKQYTNLAFELIEKLEVESDSKDSNIDVKSRVGIHAGIIILYQNAEGILRPTGLTCFIADEIASDDLAKRKGGIIVTEKIKGSLYGGSISRFKQEYESLESLDKGAAKDLPRYAKKLYPLS